MFTKRLFFVVFLALIAFAAFSASAQVISKAKGAVNRPTSGGYILEYITNEPDVLKIHLNFRVSKEDFVDTEPYMYEPGQRPPAMLTALERINGVKSASFSAKYQIWIFKGKAFKWAQVLPSALRTISGYSNRALVELEEPHVKTYYSRADRGSLMWQATGVF